MNEQRDPLLEAVFAKAQLNYSDDDFTGAVMARVERRRRRVIVGRIAIAAVLIAFEFLLASPLQTAAGALTHALGTTLVQLENSWLAITLGPLNSIAGLIGIVLFGMQFLYRRLVR